MKTIARRASLLTFFAGLTSLMAWGQGFTASVLGTVTDNTGAVVPQATVTITNTGTGQQTVVKTDGSGNYTAPQLPPGAYTVAAELQGFKRSVSDVTLQVDQRQRMDFKLELGQVSENVTITADTAQIQTETATVGTAVTNAQAAELPLNGRNFLQLNLLVPGSAPTVKGSNLSGEGGSIEVHGLREVSNYFWIDGMDNTTQAIGEIVINPPQFTIDEFRVMSPTYDAEFGRTAGAQINLITRSGGNTYHGDVYFFLRNSVFDAKNFFDPAGSIPAFRRGQFGGDVGGKIIKDKTFFFGAWEGLHYAQGESASNVVPSHQDTLGNFSDISTIIKDPKTGQQFAGNVIPTSRLDPTGLKIASYYPAPNSGTNTLLVSPTATQSDDVAVAKLDQVITSKNRLSVRAAFEDINYKQPIAQYSPTTNIPGFGINQPGAHNYTTGMSDTHMLSPTLISEVRAGWNRFEFQYFGQTNGTDYCTILGIQGCLEGKADWAFPSISMNSVYSNLGGSNTQYGNFDTIFVAPTMTWVKGRQTIKFGADYHHFDSNYRTGIGPRGTFSFRGTFSGNPLSDLLLGYPFQATKTVLQNNDAQFLFVSKEVSGFVQDDWHITPHFSLTLGLRYEYLFPATERHNHLANFDPSTGTLLVAGQNGVGNELYNADGKDFAPRVGFAWSPGASGKTAIRGGYGIFYELTQINQVLSMFNNKPFSNSYTINGDGNSIVTSTALLAATTANTPSLSAWPIDYKMGRVQEYSVNVQRQIAPNLVVDVGYVGTRGDRLYGTINLNTPPPGPGAVQARRPFPQYTNINLTAAAFRSEYDGLEIRAEKRLSKGSHFLASYTFSRAYDTSSGSGGTNSPQDPRNLDAEWGPSSYDIPQHFTFSYLYELPFGRGRTFLSGLNGIEDAILGGWQLNGIVTLHSGQPFTPVLPIDNTNTLQNSDRPNLVGDPFQSTATCQTKTPNCWANAAAFVTPPQYTFGTAGRDEVRGPGFEQIDFGLAKNFVIRERRKIEFRAEAFNLFNHPNFDLPSNSLSATFGRITTAQAPRQLQFALRFVF